MVSKNEKEKKCREVHHDFILWELVGLLKMGVAKNNVYLNAGLHDYCPPDHRWHCFQMPDDVDDENEDLVQTELHHI